MDSPTLDTTEPPRAEVHESAMETIGRMSSELNLPSDPDAQATVTDFLDFTEYLPSDMLRSLTLIGNLDQSYIEASAKVHELTKAYSTPRMPPLVERKTPQEMRAEISQNLLEVSLSRSLAYAEASRLSENVERHSIRARSILQKLRTLAENFSQTQETQPAAQQPTSPEQSSRAPKISFRFDGRPSGESSGPRAHRHRAPRITIPGEVLAPYELDYETYGSDSDDSDSDSDDSTQQTTVGGGRIKLKVPKSDKSTVPKAARPPKPPGAPGTNVHSQVAGISVTNSLLLLEAPPEVPVKGSKHAPWMRLTDWELGILRRKMKKNAVWKPSDTMIRRELQIRGRDRAAYEVAKKAAEAAGEEFPYPLPEPASNDSGQKAMPARAVSAMDPNDEDLRNRGILLNAAKRKKAQEKKERERKEKELELAKAASAANAATDEAAQSAQKIANAAKAMKTLFGPQTNAANESTAKTPVKPPKKRKRSESTVDLDANGTETEAVRSTIKPPKKAKNETPVPVPAPYSSYMSNSGGGTTTANSVQSLDLSNPSTAAQVPASSPPVMPPVMPPLMPATTTTTVPLALGSPKKSATPILPPAKERKEAKEAKETKAAKEAKEAKETKETRETRETKQPEETNEAADDFKPIIPLSAAKEVKQNVSASTRRRTPVVPTPAPEAPPARRPISRGKAASVEPVPSIGKDRLRRASTVHHTPAPEPQQPVRTTRERAKRPAPGPVVKGEEGRTAVTIGKRKAAPRKKAGPKKAIKDEEKDLKDAAEDIVEIDDEGNVIDPNEPKYCLCNRVSFGEMIGCENEDCEKEWFHFECVGVQAKPPRHEKWYCPECRTNEAVMKTAEVSKKGKKK